MGWAQTASIPEETVAFNSPEGWAMAYMTASSLNLGTTPRALRYRLAKYDLSRHRLNNGGLDQPTQSSQPHGGGGASMG